MRKWTCSISGDAQGSGAASYPQGFGAACSDVHHDNHSASRHKTSGCLRSKTSHHLFLLRAHHSTWLTTDTLLEQPHGIEPYLKGPGVAARCTEASPPPGPWPFQLGVITCQGTHIAS
eukprot:scaffold257671_cov25-Prasinocladus_malaysianus.AAC.1